MYTQDDNLDLKSIDNGRVVKPFDEHSYEVFYSEFLVWAVFKRKIFTATNMKTLKRHIREYLVSL